MVRLPSNDKECNVFFVASRGNLEEPCGQKDPPNSCQGFKLFNTESPVKFQSTIQFEACFDLLLMVLVCLTYLRMSCRPTTSRYEISPIHFKRSSRQKRN